MIRELAIVATATALLGNVACDKPGVQEQQKENKAAQDNAEAQNKAAQESTAAQAEMDKKVATAQVDFDRVRSDYRHERQKDLDDVDKKIADMEAKAKIATGATKARLEQNLPAVRAQRAAFGQDLRSVDAVSAREWDSTKARVDRDFDSLKATVDKAD